MGADTYLTSLASIKEWLAIKSDNTAADALLTRMNRSVSAFIINHLNRDGIALADYSDTYDGYGNNMMLLRRGPVFSISNMSFYGVPVPKAQGNGIDNPYSNGWVIDPDYSVVGTQRVNLYGRHTPRGRGSISVQYRAGYAVVGEQVEIENTPDPFVYNTIQFWLADEAVTIDGVPAVKVDSAPAAGQYKSEADGKYTFSIADAGKVAAITYSFVPADIQQAVIEIVGERYRYMDRIGYISKSLGGQETVTFSQKAIADFVKENLVPYINVVPI